MHFCYFKDIFRGGGMTKASSLSLPVSCFLEGAIWNQLDRQTAAVEQVVAGAGTQSDKELASISTELGRAVSESLTQKGPNTWIGKVKNSDQKKNQ